MATAPGAPFPCPHCKKRITPLPQRCPHCARDLSGLVKVKDWADRRFNEAVRAARAGRWHEAEAALLAALSVGPKDPEAEALLEKVRTNAERVRAARR